MELISLLEMLIRECYEHNGNPRHVTDKARLEHARKVVAVLRAAFDQEGDKKDG